LDVTNSGAIKLKLIYEIPTLNLDVIEIELHFDIWSPDLLKERCRLARKMQKIVGRVSPVDGLNQHLNSSRGGQICSAGKVGHEHVCRLTPGVPRYLARQAMDGRSANSYRIVERPAKLRCEILLPSWHCGPARTAIPGRIDSKHYETMLFDPMAHFNGGIIEMVS
jgi:hypothetical protein